VNLTPPDHVLLPERGVYVTRVFLPDGTSVPGVTNIGTRPTVSDGAAGSPPTRRPRPLPPPFGWPAPPA